MEIKPTQNWYEFIVAVSSQHLDMIYLLSIFEH